MSQATLGDSPYRNSNLFSGYYLDERVSDLEGWDCNEEAAEAFDELEDLWRKESSLLSSYNEDELIDAWIGEVLDVLGFDSIAEAALPDGGGHVDRLLFESEEARLDAAERKIKNDVDGMFAMSSTILEAKKWDTDFGERFSELRSYRDASHQIKYYLERTPGDLKWGVLTDGKKWRLYGTKDYETQTYYEVDLPEILESGHLTAFKYFYAFFRPEAFVEQAGSSFLNDVWAESETAAQELGEDLQDNVFRALRVLGKGFVESNDLDIDPDDEAARDELKEQSLVLLYRLMFILYAESRGLIDPDDPEDSKEYQEYFSLNSTREEILDAVEGMNVESGDAFREEYSKFSSSIWTRLSELFTLIDKGEEELEIPPYNGGLFDEESHSFLAENEVKDPYIAEVIYWLSTTETEDGEHVPADYADLDTRHLGSIYEGLLEHEFRIADTDGVAAVSEDGGQVWKSAADVSAADAVEIVDEGGLYVVNDEGERKATGAYYTPDYVVTYIVEETVDPLIEEIDKELRDQGLEPSNREYFAEFWQEVKDLTILDPAMGSGHFLTKATGYLTEQVMAVIREQEIQSYDEQYIRREISKECIYGVDLNGMAVELSKLSMWLETLSADQPLAFLDHHLKTGNSLVGSDITEVLSDGGDDSSGQLTLTQAFARVRQDTLEHVMELMSDLLAYDNETLEDVKSMENLYNEIRDDPLYQRLFELANVHTAEQFGVDIPDDAYERMASAIEDADSWADIESTDWFRSAQATAENEDFFHWELEYPEVFFGEDGGKMDEAGLDAIVGNPPYVRIQELQTNVPEQAEYLRKYQSSTQNFDLYVNFTEKGHELLSPRGHLGYIEPHKFFQNEFGEGLRSYLAGEKALEKIVSFGHGQVFENASVYTCVLILSGQESDSLEYAEIEPTELESGIEPNFRTISPELDNEPWVFKSPDVLKVIRSIEENPLSLADATKKIYQGLITSADDVFLVEKIEKRGQLTLVENGHGEQFQVESELLHPFLKGKDVKRYAPLNPPLSIILPYRVHDGELDFIQEATLQSSFPRAYEYFKSRESKLRTRDSGSMDTKRWYDFTRAQNMGEFLNSKIVTPEISYGGNFTLDQNGVLHKSKVYGLVSEDAISNEYLLTVLNSSLLWFYLQSTGYVLRGGYFTFKTDYLEPFCLPSTQTAVESTLPPALSERAVDIGESAGNGDVETPMSYSDSLEHLALERISQEQKLDELNLDLLDHLGSYSSQVVLSEMGLTQPPEDSADTILHQTTDEKPNLRVGSASVIRKSRNTVEIQMSARYKSGNEDRFETDQWGYTETQHLPALRLTDLTEKEADLIEHFVPVAVDEAGGFAEFRETATSTNSLIDRLKGIEPPDVDEVADDLDNYLETKERAEELDEKTEKTDQLVDEIVYDLYDLTDEEVEIVESTVED